MLGGTLTLIGDVLPISLASYQWGSQGERPESGRESAVVEFAHAGFDRGAGWVWSISEPLVAFRCRRRTASNWRMETRESRVIVRLGSAQSDSSPLIGSKSWMEGFRALAAGEKGSR